MSSGGKRMGSGRKPYPSEAIQSHAAKDDLQERTDNIPTGAASKLICPKDLTDEARKEWHRVIKLYKQLDTPVLNDLDRQALIMYCEAVSIYKEAQQEWREHMHILQINKSNKIIEQPYIKTMNQQAKIIATLSEELCLTPVGRIRIGLARSDQNKQSELAAFNAEFSGAL